MRRPRWPNGLASTPGKPSTGSDAPHHYKSAAEASNAGVDTGADVVWNGVAIVDFSGRTPKALRMDDALAWNGW